MILNVVGNINGGQAGGLTVFQILTTCTMRTPVTSGGVERVSRSQIIE